MKFSKQSLIITGCLVIVVAAGITAFCISRNYPSDPIEVVKNTQNISDEGDAVAATPSPRIIVHIKGAVNSPGMVELSRGDRISDAIDKAQGATNEADLNRVNLAQILNDGEEVYIPKINEKDIPQSVSSQAAGTQTKININTATASQLDSLPKIGPVTAKKIIEYRSEHPFKKTKDIMNVSGIGSKTYEEIKDKIEV